MPSYIVIETEQGLTVAQHDPPKRPEDTAVENGGVVVDPELYRTFDDAYDALLQLREAEDQEIEG